MIKYIIYGLSTISNPNNIRYIGRSSSKLNRPKIHYKNSFLKNDKNYKFNGPLHYWIRKHKKYKITILGNCPNNIIDKQKINDWLNKTEMFIIKHYKNQGFKLLNCTDGGKGLLNPNNETRQKMSEAKKGKTPWIKGKKHSKKSKQLMSKAHEGIKLSKETKQKMSEAHSGEKNHFYGKKHSKKSLKLISNASKGRIPWNKGKTHSEETKQKMSNINKGKKHSEETKQKMSKKVICLNDGKIFISIKNAAIHYNIKALVVGRICRKKVKQTKNGLKFIFYNKEKL